MKKRFKVVLIANNGHPIPDWVSNKFAEVDIDYVYHQCYNRQDLQNCASDADILWLMSGRKGLVIEENMDIFKNVGVVLRSGSGTDNVEHEACTKRGIIVAHTPEDMTECTSDHFIAMLFTAVRRTARQDRLIRSGVWDAKAALPVGHFTGAELGLIGFGRIGKAIVRKLSGFRMDIRVFDPYIDAATIEATGCKKVELEELLKVSQFVLIACPLTKETKGLLSEKELKMMRWDATLVNGARGGIVDENVLVRALKESWIKAAALDVLENPPLKIGDDLLSLETLNLTPHMGGYSDAYPDANFQSGVDVIIDISRMRLPKWIANKGVKPKWKMT